MHPEAWQWVEQVSRRIPPPQRVVDQGGQNVNGSIRSLFPGAVEWYAVDLADGPGVDIVADCGDYVHPEPCDLVTSTELLEHTPRGADIVRRAYESLKPGGYYIVTCAAPGRAPHGASGAPYPANGEYYQNVAPGDLRQWLRDAGFIDIVIDRRTDPNDVRAWARKPTS